MLHEVLLILTTFHLTWPIFIQSIQHKIYHDSFAFSKICTLF